MVRVQHLPAVREDLRVGRDSGRKILVTECVRCDDCERLYADEQKCPHWRILDYQAKKLKVLPLRPI